MSFLKIGSRYSSQYQRQDDSTGMTELLRGLGMSEFCSIATIRVIYIILMCIHHIHM